MDLKFWEHRFNNRSNYLFNWGDIKLLLIPMSDFGFGSRDNWALLSSSGRNGFSRNLSSGSGGIGRIEN